MNQLLEASTRVGIGILDCNGKVQSCSSNSYLQKTIGDGVIRCLIDGRCWWCRCTIERLTWYYFTILCIFFFDQVKVHFGIHVSLTILGCLIDLIIFLVNEWFHCFLLFLNSHFPHSTMSFPFNWYYFADIMGSSCIHLNIYFPQDRKWKTITTIKQSVIINNFIM